jgi:hypothetical protein
MGLLSGVLDPIFGGDVDVPKRPDMPRKELRDRIAARLQAMFDNLEATPEYRETVRQLGDSATRAKTSARRQTADQMSRTGGTQSGAYRASMRGAGLQVDQQYVDSLRRAMQRLRDARFQRAMGLISQEAGFESGVYGPYASASISAQQFNDPFARMVSGVNAAANAKRAFRGGQGVVT